MAITTTWPSSMVTMVCLTPPNSMARASPPARLVNAETMAESSSALRPCWESASSSPSAETTTASATPGTWPRKSPSSQWTFIAAWLTEGWGIAPCDGGADWAGASW